MDLVERRWGGPEAFLAKNAELFRSPKASERRDVAFDTLVEQTGGRSTVSQLLNVVADAGGFQRDDSADDSTDSLDGESDGIDQSLSRQKMKDLRSLKKKYKQEEEDEREHLKRIEEKYQLRKEQLEEDIKQLQGQLEDELRKLDKLELDQQQVRSFHGPRCLRFVEGDVFTVVSTSIVVLNVLALIKEMTDERYKDIFFWVDQAFLVFYIVELVLRGLLLQKDLLLGPLREVWWNWLDVFIVLAGIYDQWILTAMNQTSSLLVSAVRILRLLRLIRLAKVVRAFLKSELEWVEEDCFQGFILSAILVNSLLLGVQTDWPDFFLWNALEEVLLVVFLFELLVRVKLHKWRFFTDPSEVPWNLLDTIIVVAAVVDQWMLPIFSFASALIGGKPEWGTDSSEDMGSIFLLLRMARLFRILRLARLIHSLPPLYNLVLGVAYAMQGMFWVLVLTVLLLYICAILAVLLIEKGLLFSDGRPPANLKGIFSGVFESMFVLFLVMNGDFDSVQEILDAIPSTQLACALFMILSNWAILAIFTAVVSENMITTVEDRRRENDDVENKDKTDRSVVKLTELFNDMDKREQGLIYASEFDRILSDEDQEAELCDAAGISSNDLNDLTKLLSHSPADGGEAYILEEDFLTGLKKQNDVANERSMMRLEKKIMALEDKLRHWMQQQAVPSQQGRPQSPQGRMQMRT
ncbi:Cacna1s [Symbiodinium natans]|uniref:Cacna1s protein n=1 Tax=Symbiodinium natans TaxID=878477 RepID=A0A812RD68_9DINO|nr:Cacna1s [Symbiodinium natans]